MNGLYEFLTGLRVAYKALAFAPDEVVEEIKEIALKMGEELEKVTKKYLSKEDQEEFTNAVIAFYLCMIGMGSVLVRERDFDGEEFMDMAYEFFRICLREKGMTLPEGLEELRRAVLKGTLQLEKAKQRFSEEMKELQDKDKEVI